MSVLAIIWTMSIALSVAAVLSMVMLIFTRIARELRAASRTKIKSTFTKALLLAAEGKPSILPTRGLSRREQGILIGAGIEILDLVRGATALKIVQVLTACGINEVLARWIKSPNPIRRAAAAEALAHVADHDGRLALAKALNDGDHDVRLAAAASLVKLGAAPPLQRLVATLGAHGTPSARLGQILTLIFQQHPGEVLGLAQDARLNPFVRSKAIETIASTGELSLLPHLTALTEDADADVRTAAIRALGRLSHPGSAEALARAFGDPAWFVRAAAAEAAGRIGLYELVPALTALVDDGVWWVRFRASEALVALDEAGRSALRRIAAEHRGRASQAASVALAEGARRA